MRFDDEPVPGYPLPILPGHTSPGRLERVLRGGGSQSITSRGILLSFFWVRRQNRRLESRLWGTM